MANKKGKLSKSELYYIQENPDNLSEGELAKELKRPIQIIAKTIVQFKQKLVAKQKKKTKQVVIENIDDVEIEENVEVVPNDDGSYEPTLLAQQFAHDTTGRRGYAIMTPNASQQSDALTGKGPSNVNRPNGRRNDQSHIFKPIKGKPTR